MPARVLEQRIHELLAQLDREEARAADDWNVVNAMIAELGTVNDRSETLEAVLQRAKQARACGASVNTTLALLSIAHVLAATRLSSAA